MLSVRPDHSIRLVMVASELPPIIPIDQCFLFSDLSRRQIYSKQNYKATAHLAQAIYEDHSSAVEEKRTQSTKSTNFHHFDAPKSKSMNAANSSISNEGGLPSIVGEEAATAITEAAGVVGR